MMEAMNKDQLEPGLLQIFRWYVILRGIFYLLTPLTNSLFDSKHPLYSEPELSLMAIFFVVNILLLGAYLFNPWVQRFLGNAYLPVALIVAAVGLILEQHYISGMRGFWQPLPFLYILLLLVAWQYRFSYVLVFTFGTLLLDIVLMQLSPPPQIPRFIPSERELSMVYGRMITSTVSYLVLGYVVNRMITAQRAQRQKLSDANLKLVQHAATVEQLTLSRERNRISRELHDTLAHTLSALAVQFDALSTVMEPLPEKARSLIERMQQTTRSGLDETRRTLRNLRASPLEEMGLSLAIRAISQDFAARTACNVELELPDTIEGLVPDVEQCFYRVAQEALANIARHAAAQNVSVCLTHNKPGLQMTIADDGRGFDAEKGIPGDRLGMQGMYERAGIIGARLRVESSPAAGTTLELTLAENAP